MNCDNCPNEIVLENGSMAIEELARKADWLGWQSVKIRGKVIVYCPTCWNKIAGKWNILEMFDIKDSEEIMDAKEKIELMNKFGNEVIEKIHPSCSLVDGKLVIQLQVGHPDEEGSVSGCFGTHAVRCLLELHKYYQTQIPSRETALVVTKLEEAWLWLKSRELDRDQRGVLQTDKK